MNKAELTEQIAENGGLTKVLANKVIDSFANTVIAELKKGNRVTIKDFGTFSVTKRAARNGRNPKTGATLKIKASKAVKFSTGKEFMAILSE
jgi:DNA-binding protein HU-beta